MTITAYQLKNLTVNDWVWVRHWVGIGSVGNDEQIRQVKAETKSILTVGHSKFRRSDGTAYERHHHGGITRLADTQDIAAELGRQAAEDQKKKDRAAAEEAQKAKHEELRALFADKNVWVTNDGADRFVVHGLTERQIRTLTAA